MSTRTPHSTLEAERGEASRRSTKSRSPEKLPKGEAPKTVTKAVLPTAARKEWRQRFLRQYPRGFYDPRHVERATRWGAHELWDQQLNRREFYRQIRREDWGEIINRALQVEASAKLLSAAERQSLRDMLKPAANAKLFGKALFDLLHAPGRLPVKFIAFTQTIAPLLAKLPKGHAWPAATIFPFLANPDEHVLVRPSLMQSAAESYAFSLSFDSTPNWQTYARLMAFADVLKSDLSDLQPRDMIDVHCFLSMLAAGDEA